QDHLRKSSEAKLAEDKKNFEKMKHDQELLSQQLLSEIVKKRDDNLKAKETEIKDMLTNLKTAQEKEKSDLIKKSTLGLPNTDDPFYRPRTLNPEVQETDKAYIVRVQVPEKEKDHVDI